MTDHGLAQHDLDAGSDPGSGERSRSRTVTSSPTLFALPADAAGSSSPDKTPIAWLVVSAPTNPVGVARDFLDRRRRTPDGTTSLLWQGGSFWYYDGTCWPEVDPPDLRSELYTLLEHAQYTKVTKGEVTLEPWQPTRHKVDDVIDALRSAVNTSSRTQPPCWIGPDPDLPAKEMIPFGNGLLHLPTRRLLEHTPSLWVHHSLPFAYDPHAPEPIGWLRFLNDLWDDDTEATALLQEWFGYCLSGDTSQQKALLTVGPKRSGKGTIARVLNAIMGAHNVCGPTLSSMATTFGLAPLVGKPLAVVSDARLSDKRDSSVVLERLLSITGEDLLTVDRKYREAWTGRLPTRFVVLSNELPRFSDSSGALASRFLVLMTERSWYSREDPMLTDKLLTEAPGILNWALEGLARLRDRGHFVQPSSSTDALEAMSDMASPVGAFVRDRCVVGNVLEVDADRLWEAWTRWCQDQGVRVGDRASFGRDLRTAVPTVHKARPRNATARRHVYFGIGLAERRSP